jgi:hypothetical protein
LDQAVFTEVVLPLLGVRDTVLLAISTPLESSNFYSQLLAAKKPNGSTLFKVIQIQLICAECLAKGITDNCPHGAPLPQWKSSARGDLVKTLMSSDEQMFLREQAGVVTENDTNAFDVESIIRMEHPSTYVNINSSFPAELYVAIDPAGGGASEFALAVGFYDLTYGSFVLCGAESAVLPTDQSMELFLRGFFEKLRGINSFRSSAIVVFIELNYGGSVLASRVANILSSFVPVHFVTDEPRKKSLRIGVLTTALVKERGRLDVQRLLRLNQLRFSKPFVSSTEDMPSKIVKQLKGFKYIVQQLDAGSTKRPKIELSGKSYGTQDDLSMAILLLIFWSGYALSEGDKCWVV